MLALIAVGVLMTAGSVSAAQHIGQRNRTELSPEQKQALEQIRELREEGNFEAIKALVEENDLHFLAKHHRGEKRIDARTAIENNDYNAFVVAAENAPFAENVDEEFFAEMVAAYNLRQSGDIEGARAIMRNLGIHPQYEKAPRMNRETIKNLTDEQRAVLDQAKALHKSGDHEGARELVESLGLDLVPRR